MMKLRKHDALIHQPLAWALCFITFHNQLKRRVGYYPRRAHTVMSFNKQFALLFIITFILQMAWVLSNRAPKVKQCDLVHFMRVHITGCSVNNNRCHTPPYHHLTPQSPLLSLPLAPPAAAAFLGIGGGRCLQQWHIMNRRCLAEELQRCGILFVHMQTNARWLTIFTAFPCRLPL
jgi:hypothetical protein